MDNEHHLIPLVSWYSRKLECEVEPKPSAYTLFGTRFFHLVSWQKGAGYWGGGLTLKYWQEGNPLGQAGMNHHRRPTAQRKRESHWADLL